MLPKDILPSDSLYIEDFYVRADYSNKKSVILNLKKQPKAWLSTADKTIIETYRSTNVRRKAKAYVLDHSREPKRLIRYSCFCIKDIEHDSQ